MSCVPCTSLEKRIIIIIIIIINLNLSAPICWDTTYPRLSMGIGTIRGCGRLDGFFISLGTGMFLLAAVPQYNYISTIGFRLCFS